MNDWILSQIRTYVPVIVGALLSWLLSIGLDLGSEAQVGLVTFLTAVTTAAYYSIARILERWWPPFGKILLGSSKTPVYAEASSSVRVDGITKR